MILATPATWPRSLLDYLASQHEMLLAHAQHEHDTMRAYLAPENDTPMAMMPSNPHFAAHEDAAQTVLQLLQRFTLRGWHCTRLTSPEVDHIKSYGMQPPDLQTLRDRIRQVQTAQKLNAELAERLIRENQADDDNRKGIIWFCFFEPRVAGQSGIERFFRRWGGEALYNSHERDPDTGEALRSIGRPCLIEADVLVSSFGPYTFLGDKVIRRYILSHGFDTGEGWEHDDKSRGPIPAANIVRFVFHGETDFAALTGCDSWKPPLDL